MIVSPASTIPDTDADNVKSSSLLVARIPTIARVVTWFGIVPRPLIFHTTPPVVFVVGVVAPITIVNCVGLITDATAVGTVWFGKSLKLNTHCICTKSTVAVSQCGTSVVTVAVVLPDFDIFVIFAIGFERFARFLQLYNTL